MLDVTHNEDGSITIRPQQLYAVPDTLEVHDGLGRMLRVTKRDKEPFKFQWFFDGRLQTQFNLTWHNMAELRSWLNALEDL